MSDEELELHIADLGRLIEKAMAEGDRAAAVAWAQSRTQAIMARSPERIAAMELDYFGERGEADRLEL